jgi:hypothetical protein
MAYSADLSRRFGAIRFRLRSLSYGGRVAIAPYGLDTSFAATSLLRREQRGRPWNVTLPFANTVAVVAAG